MNYYNPYQPVMPNQFMNNQPTPQPTYNNGGDLFFVGSEDEAKNWIVNPNQTVYLLDRNNARLYIKSVENNGLSLTMTCILCYAIICVVGI